MAEMLLEHPNLRKSETMSEDLANFVSRASYKDMSASARDALKVRVLDSLGCMIAALDGEPIPLIWDQLEEFGRGRGSCTLLGSKTGGSPDRASLWNGVLLRYVDFMDSYMTKEETCHPSDNFASVLAAAEYAESSGRHFLESLAVAYQVQCRLLDKAPVTEEGFDHTTQQAFSVAAGVSKALDLEPEKTANAVGICGASFYGLNVIRTGQLSNWKGLASGVLGCGCTEATFLAMRGVTGPKKVFEGKKGFMESIAKGKFKLDWSKERLNKVVETDVKRYNSEVHTQSIVEGLMELREENQISPRQVKRVRIDAFEQVYEITGGGESDDRKMVRNKETADHSLPYVTAVTLIDGQLMPEQYSQRRIMRRDVQELLQRVDVRKSEKYTERYPRELCCKIVVELKSGQKLVKVKTDFLGMRSRPMSWEQIVEKFETLAYGHADESLRKEIVRLVSSLDRRPLGELCELLSETKITRSHRE